MLGTARALALARDRIRTSGLVSKSEVAPYFDQIDAGVPQCIDEAPETGVIHCAACKIVPAGSTVSI
jgi:hypothetical protein